MITRVTNREKLLYSPNRTGHSYIEIYGLSTDVKPIDVPNATPFLEMDKTENSSGNLVNKVYLFDEENKVWLPMNE